MSALLTLSNTLADRFGMGSDANLVQTLKQTAFKGEATEAQLIALLIVANQYGLNPFTKEIYAFPDKNNNVVPVVGVDGWSRIINNHIQFDGMDFEQDEQSCTCSIYRKDRSRAIKVTEYMSECKRNLGPWLTHPKRMLRHKAMIQCARLAFGYGGIYDTDEAERIQEEKQMGHVEEVQSSSTVFYSDIDFTKNFPTWSKTISSGKKTAEQIIMMVKTKCPLTDEQMKSIREVEISKDAQIKVGQQTIIDENGEIL